MDCFLTDDERRRYEAWLHSPSVHGPQEEELILAYKIARALGGVPSKVLKVLRGVEGQNPDLVQRVEQFVEQDPTLGYTGAPPQRRVTLPGD